MVVLQLRELSEAGAVFTLCYDGDIKGGEGLALHAFANDADGFLFMAVIHLEQQFVVDLQDRADVGLVLQFTDQFPHRQLQDFRCGTLNGGIHGGPFANIAHGCNSIMATKFALKYADYVVTEAGFGADLGAEKFLDIKCRFAGIHPDAVVIVATVRALKMHGGMAKADLTKVDMQALERGLGNLAKHIENIQKFGLPAVVAVNAFPTDTKEELDFVEKKCHDLGAEVALSEVWAKGGEGGLRLAEKVEAAMSKPCDFKFIYDEKDTVENKIAAVAREIYGADGVAYTDAARKQLEDIHALGFDKMPVCMAKTQYSLSDDLQKLGRPTGFCITVKELRVSAGAGFLVVLTGNILTMPGLPKKPAAENMDITQDGKITGLF